MRAVLPRLALVLLAILSCGFPAGAQLRPPVTAPAKKKKPAPKKPEKPAEAKPTEIVVQTSPNAEVYLDDQFAGRASAEGRLVIANPKPGAHSLRVSLPGKQEFKQNVSVVAGESAKVDATLADLPAQLVVETSPGAEVYLDDSRRGAVDASGELGLGQVAPGSHELRISARGKKNYQQQVTVLPGQEAKVEAVLADIERPAAEATKPGSVKPSRGGEPTAGTVRENPKDGLKYVWIPPGTFMMGCSPGDSGCAGYEEPSHQVTITKGFWIGQTEVTVGAYKRFSAAAGHQMPEAPSFNKGWANANMPIVRVTWHDAQAYCGWVGGRLPTEAEWEYAARGGSAEARYGNIDDIAWYDKTSGDQPHQVAQRRANGFGLFDVLGNVWELVNDWGENFYRSSPSQDPSGPSSGQKRVLRGGSWYSDPELVRVSFRNWDYPAGRNDTYGIRCGGEVISP